MQSVELSVKRVKSLMELENKKFGNKLENWSDKMSLLALQGPKSYNILEKVINFDIHALKNYSFIICNLGLAKNVIVSTTGYTGSGGVEIYCDNKDVDLIWRTLFDYGKEFDLKVSDLKSNSRKQSIVMARGVSVYLSRELLGVSFLKIGSYLGNRDHSTIMHANRKIEKLISSDSDSNDTDSAIQSIVFKLKQELTEKFASQINFI